MKKLLCFVSLISVLLLSFSGCGFGSTNIDEMLKAPAFSGELAKVDKALKKSTGEEITLKNPIEGEHRSAFVLKDIDGNGKKEAFVFYSKKSDSNVDELHMNFLRQTNNWESVNDILINGDQINELSFIDINNDEVLEVFLGVTSVSSTLKVLEGYMVDNSILTQCFKENYSVFESVDINKDLSEEIITIELDTEQKISLVNAYKIEREGYESIGNCMLDGKVLSYNNPASSMLTNGSPAIFIDADKGNNSMITEIIYWDNGLIAPLYDSISMENTITLRNSDIKSKDYNGDGYYDIPFLQEFSQTVLAEDGAKTYITQWRCYDSKQFHTVANELTNYYDGYSLQIPDEQLNKFTLKRELETKERIFYSYDSKSGKQGNEIFRIKTFSDNEWDKNDDNGFKKLAESNKKVFAIKVTDKSYTIEYISKTFKVLD